MSKVVFIQADGSRAEVDIENGVSVMDGAVNRGVDGIDADCGGQLACATCHIKVAPRWMEALNEQAPQSEDELAMLEFAHEPDEWSRLSCQILMTPLLDGLEVIVPETQG